MARHTRHSQAEEDAEQRAPGQAQTQEAEGREAESSAETNGGSGRASRTRITPEQMAPPEGGPALTGEEEASAMERAEEMVDRIAEKVGQYTSIFGRQLLRLGARAREELEDMWAEAQEIRRRAQP